MARPGGDFFAAMKIHPNNVRPAAPGVIAHRAFFLDQLKAFPFEKANEFAESHSCVIVSSSAASVTAVRRLRHAGFTENLAGLVLVDFHVHSVADRAVGPRS